MAKVYALKKNIDFKELEALGYTYFSEQDTVAKLVTQPLNGKAVESIMNNYYCNYEWIEKIYNEHQDIFIKKLGLKYNKNKKPRMTKRFKEVLESWFIQIESDDRWLGFTSYDNMDPHVFYACSVLDEFCAEEIENLKYFDFIEELEIKD